jgi:hypothetical protein
VLPTVTLLATLALGPAPGELPPIRADVDPDSFRLRTGSLELGVGWRPTLSDQGAGNYPPPCGFNVACGVTPRLGFDFEFGRPAARLLLGTYHAPMPTFSGNIATIEAFMIEIGALFGGPRIRAGVSATAARPISAPP